MAGAWPAPYTDHAPPASESKASGMGHADSMWADRLARVLRYAASVPSCHPEKTLVAVPLATSPPSTGQKHGRSIVPLPPATTPSGPGCTLRYGWTTSTLPPPSSASDAYTACSKRPPAGCAAVPKRRSPRCLAAATAGTPSTTSPLRGRSIRL